MGYGSTEASLNANHELLMHIEESQKAQDAEIERMRERQIHNEELIDEEAQEIQQLQREAGIVAPEHKSARKFGR